MNFFRDYVGKTAYFAVTLECHLCFIVALRKEELSMSYENNTNKVGQCAGAAGGISATQNKSSFINATFANRVLNLIDRDGVMAKVIRNPVGQLGTAPVKRG